MRTAKYQSEFKACLKRFPFFRTHHRLTLVRNGSQVHIGYHGTATVASFDLQIDQESKTVYILHFAIHESARRRGIGTFLYSLLEKFFSQVGINRIEVTPSGQGTYFWPKMGFEPWVQYSWVKLLQISDPYCLPH